MCTGRNWAALVVPGGAVRMYWAVLGMKWAALGGPEAAMGFNWAAGHDGSYRQKEKMALRLGTVPDALIPGLIG